MSILYAPELTSDTPENGVVLFSRANNFAAIKHKEQRRKDAEHTPYINHPIGVAAILANECEWWLAFSRAHLYTGGVTDVNVLCAALLHDTVEDTDTTFDELTLHFGAHIMQIVRECTDDKTLPYDVRKEMQVTNAPHKSHEAKLVKLADKLYNLRDLARSTPEGWTVERVRKYHEWASRVCHGCMGTHALLEAKVDQVLAPYNVSIENPARK